MTRALKDPAFELRIQRWHAEHENLKRELYVLISPYASGFQQPPFTAGELIIIAMVLGDHRPRNQGDLLSWLMNTFRFFSNQLVTKWADDYLSDRRLCYAFHEINDPVPGFAKAFLKYDLPIKLVSSNLRTQRDTYAADPRACRTYLRRLLEAPRHKTFRFLDLSSELRNIVYEMAFSYPKSGIRIIANSRNKITSLQTQHREGISSGGSVMNWESNRGGPITLPAMSRILSLLSVNRQINAEATPIFYNINTFLFPNPRLVLALSNRMAPNRFSNITRLALDINAKTDFKSWIPFTRLLAEHKPFNFLGITTDDKSWLKLRPAERAELGRKTPFKEIKQVPGFFHLAVALSMAKTFELSGLCDGVKEYVAAEVLRIKARPEIIGKHDNAVKRIAGRKEKKEVKDTAEGKVARIKVEEVD
ncbi:hypothetical protein TI39_contig353g00025 [Zymoseptoria brevis]|uniref:DUF7730 domain-containing protein n=1 Tax=Zymoseptoria brevis TaxID=1047168 RepID=A0A0F4GU23_9PEZI|nr:hypothetical protein TI39_contig353g00025 [Zymoseptoria brevis]